jgi:hypothetical protein
MTVDPEPTASEPRKPNEYYIQNRTERLRYQREYYYLRKAEIAEKRLQRKEKDPGFTVKQAAYNQAYYRKNKAAIQAKRNARKATVQRLRQSEPNA